MNDAFASATAIAALPFDDPADLTDATIESGEPAFCYPGSKSAWYTFTPAENTTLAASFSSSAYGGAVAIYTADGAGLAGLANYACVDPFNKSAMLPVTAGRTYVFQAHDAAGSLGALGLHIAVYAPPTPPANNNFADASAIPTVPFQGSVDLTAATVEPGEAFALPHRNCAPGVGSVWYDFTAPQDETLKIGATTADNFGVYASVWREDGPGFAGLTGINCSSSSGGGAIVPVEAGAKYAIDVVDFVGGVSLASIDIQIVSPPPNDEFAEADVISTLPFSDTLDATAATTQPGEKTPTCAPGPITRSVFLVHLDPGTGYVCQRGRIDLGNGGLHRRLSLCAYPGRMRRESGTSSSSRRSLATPIGCSIPSTRTTSKATFRTCTCKLPTA